jgi:polyhydroxybutyrate depolymerase
MIEILLALAVGAPPPHLMNSVPQTVVRALEVDGRRRVYREHAPPAVRRAGPVPLVLVFHGGGSTALGMERESRFSDLADREGFIAVYPEGYGRSWNDGRGEASTAAVREGVDDVRFVARLLDEVESRHAVDRRRVFATGISNGAMLAHLLAVRLADRIAAIAPVAGGLAEPVSRTFAPARPVSILVVQGTADPLVPYDGGVVGRRARGAIIGTDAVLGLWRRANGTSEIPREEVRPDRVPTDGCRVHVRTWGGGRDGTSVSLLRLEGGGHTWPGGTQYLPRLLIGGVCREIDGTEAIWDFLARHGRR